MLRVHLLICKSTMVLESWVVLSLIAYTFFSTRFLIKYFNVDENTAPMVMCLLLGIIALMHCLYSCVWEPGNMKKLFDKKQAFVLFVVALTWYIANIYYIKAMLLSPNSGYVHAFAVVQVMIVFFLSVWLLGDKPKPTKVLGMILAMIAIVMMSI